jgi:hypothetical protein
MSQDDLDQGYQSSATNPRLHAIRFRVVDPSGASGSSWLVRTSRNNGDVVVTHREAGHLVHATFHYAPPGEWHFALTAEEPTEYLPLPYPPTVVGHGWRLFMKIVVPLTELRRDWVEEASSNRSIIEVPVWPEYGTVSIWVLIGENDRAPLTFTHSYEIAELVRADVGVARIVALPTVFDEDPRSGLRETIEMAEAGIREAGWDGTCGTRFVIPAFNDEGHLSEFEFALDPITDPAVDGV